MSCKDDRRAAKTLKKWTHQCWLTIMEHGFSRHGKTQQGERFMDIDDLLTFVEVADTGGISPAARRLGVSKSIVSRRLARLETELSTQLLARTTRGAALTEAGSTFREYAARACAEIEAARETLLPTGDLRGRLRVAVSLSFGPADFAPVLARMALNHPRLHIHLSFSDRFVDLIAEGFDCAIRVGYLPDSSLMARRVGPIYGKLVASPQYIKMHGTPDNPKELVNHHALMQGTEAWQFMDGKKIESFEDLRVWQAGIQLVKSVYLVTNDGGLAKDFGLRDQLRRAAVSIPTNIAEGFERASRKEYVQFLNIAKGSAGEVRSLLRVALEVGYLDAKRHDQLRDTVVMLSRSLSNQIKAIKDSSL